MSDELKWKLVRNPVAPGQVRPDVKRDLDRGAADAELRRHQARVAEVPQPKLGEKQIEVAHSTPLPPAPTKNPISEKIAPRTPLSDTQTRPEPRQPATAAQPNSEGPTIEAREQLVRAGIQAAKDLAKLARGGAGTVMGTITAATKNLTSAAQLLPKAFARWAPRTAEGLAKKSPIPTTAPKGPEASQTELARKTTGLVRPVGESATGDPVAAHIAQKAPSPFAPEMRPPQTDRKATKLLDTVTSGLKSGLKSGIQRVVAAAAGDDDGFTAGGHLGGFGNFADEFAGLAKKLGAVPHVHVYGEPDVYPETEGLYAKLSLTRLLDGVAVLMERVRVSIGDRIANTQDDTPFILRVKGSAKDHEQMAKGTRGSVYGPGRMIG